MDRWTEFRHQLSAAADVHGYGRILDPNYTVPSRFSSEYESYDLANRFIYAALKYNTVSGTALTKILRYNEHKDGRAAWNALTDWYESQGSADNKAKHAMDDLQSYKLTATTPHGAEGYTSRLEKNIFDLHELGYQYPPELQKHFFLKNIIDPAYGTIVEILDTDDRKGYEDCLNEIRRKASDLDIKGRSRRNINNTSQNNKN